MTRILAFTNNKGGTGKSTLCANAAHVTALKGKRVLLIDLTSQMTACSSFLPGTDQLAESDTILALLKSRPSRAIEDLIYESEKGPDVIPSHFSMAKALTELVKMTGSRSHILQKAIEPIQSQYDFIFIDSPGDLNELMANALVPADLVLIPTRLNRTDFQCTEATLRFIDEAARFIGDRPARVILNMLDDRYLPGHSWAGSHTGQLYEQACKTFGEVLSPVTIPDSSDIRTAFDRGLTVMEYRPDTAAAQRIQALVEREVFL